MSQKAQNTPTTLSCGKDNLWARQHDTSYSIPIGW